MRVIHVYQSSLYHFMKDKAGLDLHQPPVFIPICSNQGHLVDDVRRRPLTEEAHSKWHYDVLLSHYFGFLLSVSFHECFHMICS